MFIKWHRDNSPRVFSPWLNLESHILGISGVPPSSEQMSLCLRWPGSWTEDPQAHKPTYKTPTVTSGTHISPLCWWRSSYMGTGTQIQSLRKTGRAKTLKTLDNAEESISVLNAINPTWKWSAKALCLATHKYSTKVILQCSLCKKKKIRYGPIHGLNIA